MFTTLISLYLTTLLNQLPQAEVARPTGNINSSALADILSAYPVPSPIQSEKQSNTAEASSSTSSPDIKASAYIGLDIRSGKILIEKNTKEKRSIGSITKLMTALIILDENNINDVVNVPVETTQVEGSKIWLTPKEKITIKDLLYAMLIHSGNDAAYALALHNSGSIEAFVSKMNEKARKLGLTQTHFGNPAGLDRDNNYSSAYDVSQLGVYAYRNNFIRSTVAISKITISSISGLFKHELKSTNELLERDSRIKGLKTGYTVEAGHSFVGVAMLGNGTPILTVVLDSPDRFKETTTLVDWISHNYIW